MPRKFHWFALSALCAARAWAVDAPIQSVTLYGGGATVERVVHVTPGMAQVEITGLLANFDTSTVRLQADPGIQIGQVVTRDQGSAGSPSPRQAELEAKIQALQDQSALIDAERKSAQLVQSYLERLGSAGAPAERAAAPDPKTMPATLDAIRKGGADALQRMHDADVRQRALTKQIDAQKRDLDKARSGARDGRTLTIALAVKQPGKVLLSYQVKRAGWAPIYRATLDSNASTVDLERMATISQKTGEDWSGVQLRLSTGQPDVSPDAPDPGPWTLSYQPPQRETAYARILPEPAPVAAAPGMPVVVTGLRAERKADDYIPPVLEANGNFATEFAVPTRVDLASDGREISVGLSRQTLKVAQRVRIAPRDGGVHAARDAAVVTVEAPRPDGVWLSGEVQLQRDGAYVGAVDWNPQAGERLTLPFGRDPLVRVAIEHRSGKSGQAGLFGQDRQKRIADTYAVTSFHKQPVDILVLEPTPVSESDKVTVKAGLKPEPGVKEWEHRRGLVGWERTLQPGETARFDVDYVIDYPKDGDVPGL